MKQLLSILLLLCMLTGCSPSVSKPPPDPKPERPAEVVEVPEAPGILDKARKLDANGILRSVPNTAIDSGTYQELYAFGDQFFLYGLRYDQASFGSLTADLYMAVMDPQTGIVSRETILEDTAAHQIQICDKQVSVFDPQNGNLYIYDENLDLTVTHQLEPTWDIICTDNSCQKFYRFSYESGVFVTDLNTMETEAVLEEATGVSAPFVANTDSVCFSYVSLDSMLTKYAVLDLKTGSLKQLSLSGDFYNLTQSDTAFLSASSVSYDYRLERNDAIWQIPAIPNGSLHLLPETERLFSITDTDGRSYTLSLYDLDGTHISTCRYKTAIGATLSTPVWSEQHNGYFILCSEFNGTVSLLFWDCSTPSEGMALPLTALPETSDSGEAVDISLYERAGSLGERYGIRVRIADQCDTVFNSYTTEQVYDAWTIIGALDALESALSVYPDGFFAQLGYGTQPEVEIQLVGTLASNPPLDENANGFTSFVAFVEQQPGKNVIAMDIHQTGYLEQNFHHELSHIIDEKLAFDAIYREGALYSESDWIAQNPDGFTYTYDYHNLPEGIYTDGWDDYFIDIYARTYPGEDRARIFEYAMIGADWIFADPLREKLAYYSACIRDCFDTTGWPDVTPWEAVLDPA